MQLYEAKTEVLKTSVISVIGTCRFEKCSKEVTIYLTPT